MTWGHEKNKQWKKARTHIVVVCVCGDDRSDHGINLFTGKRACKQCHECHDFYPGREERRFKTA
jgi:beta-mannanase